MNVKSNVKAGQSTAAVLDWWLPEWTWRETNLWKEKRHEGKEQRQGRTVNRGRSRL